MGGVVHTIVAPIERAKLLLQTQESNLAIVSGPHRRFKGMIDCIVRTVKEEGILSLWRGNGSSVLRYYPSVALNFSLKDDKFERLFKLYADKVKQDVQTLVFIFDGDKIGPSATPCSLGMEEDDMIEVHRKSS